MPPNRFESEVESFLEGSHGDRTHIKRADHPRLHHYAGHYSDGGREREIVRPAHEKWPKIGCLWRAERILSRVEWGRGRAGRILSRLPARYYQRPWLGHRPRPRYPPRNSPWHDTIPAPPPTAGPAAILCGASAPTTSASVGVLQH